jgi:hypothetical protein
MVKENQEVKKMRRRGAMKTIAIVDTGPSLDI